MQLFPWISSITWICVGSARPHSKYEFTIVWTWDNRDEVAGFFRQDEKLIFLTRDGHWHVERRGPSYSDWLTFTTRFNYKTEDTHLSQQMLQIAL